ncbi:hypothetical protein TL16_g09445 [Triparma laevis f. inornata]|uniref:EF-hand domain-containing protein n=1 Tax=Triparma laevis f. inornata TaxID=1714386 RepID=A0A9W7EL05_9STRA|nr:hypothetical protein TL16_g09445 [Triparma laevis f. inornata]
MNVTVPFAQAQPQYMQVGGQMVDINCVVGQFTNIDATGDGKLSLDEFRRGQHNVLGQMYNDQMCCMMFQSLDMNHDGSLDLREYLMGNGVERQAAKAVMDSWRAQRKAVKSQIASERARQKAEREQAKAERELERERARNDRLERQQYGGVGGCLGITTGAFAKRKKENGYGKKVKKMNVKKLEAEILKAFKERFKRSLEFKQPQARVISLASLQSKKARSVDDITIVTQCSIDRAERLKAMCKGWGGAISCAIHIPPGKEGGMEKILKTLVELHQFVEKECACKLDLILRQEKEKGDGLYPINALRNAALEGARTERVLLLDVDFEVSAGANEKLKEGARKAGPGVALVVPAFELSYDMLGKEEELLVGHKQGLEQCEGISGFHVGHFPRGHRATKFGVFFGAQEDYAVDYEDCYEPYIVVSKSLCVKYDERFRGYGLNKVSQIMALSKTHTFKVSHSTFVISPEMAKSESWQKMYGKSLVAREPLLKVKVQVLFDRFRKELDSQKFEVKKGKEEDFRGGKSDFVFEFGESIEEQVIGVKAGAWLAKALFVVVGAGMIAVRVREEYVGVGVY